MIKRHSGSGVGGGVGGEAGLSDHGAAANIALIVPRDVTETRELQQHTELQESRERSR